MGNQKTKAVFLMLASSFSFSVMQIFVKLSSAEVGTLEQTFFRNLFSLIVAAQMVHKEKAHLLKEIRQGSWYIWARSIFGFLGIILYFYAAGHARQADVAMLNRSAPVFVTLFAALFLKEKISAAKIASTLLCLGGAYIAMQPSFDSNPFPLLSALLAAVVSGIAYTMLARCKNLTSPAVIIFHFSALSTICSGLLMLPSFVVPSRKTFFMLLLIGLFAALGQFLLTYAYQKAPASEVSIYQYSGVAFTAVLSFLLLSESLSASSILGSLVILSAILWMFLYNRKRDAI